jgi:hypothetical protein
MALRSCVCAWSSGDAVGDHRCTTASMAQASRGDVTYALSRDKKAGQQREDMRIR